MATVIETQGLTVAFGDGVERNIVFRDLNVGVEEGEFVTLVGMSGVGKSTLLRVVADLVAPHAGTVKVETERDPTRRPIAMVFQAALLSPSMDTSRR